MAPTEKDFRSRTLASRECCRRRTFLLPLSENKQLEAIIRGFANHHRIALLLLLADSPNLTLDGCAKALDLNVKTASGHLRELSINGFVDKEADGREVHHTLTPRGEAAVAFIQSMKQDAK